MKNAWIVTGCAALWVGAAGCAAEVGEDVGRGAHAVVEAVPDGSYEIVEYDGYGDQLFRFHLSGDQVLFESDPTVTTWGTDYWGYWADPFPFADDVVQFFRGLSNVQYDFEVVGDGLVHVTRTLVTVDYGGGILIDEVKPLGVYGRYADAPPFPDDGTTDGGGTGDDGGTSDGPGRGRGKGGKKK